MTRLLLSTAALALVAVVGYLRGALPRPVVEPKLAESLAQPQPAMLPDQAGFRTHDDPAEVFRRAFWREPVAEDRILHAERREWATRKNGVSRWQWFLALEPGGDLTAWLRENNPFQLAKVDRASFQAIDGAPAWFPGAAALTDCEILQSADQGMTLIFDSAKHRLYATDAGRGFALSQKPLAARPVTLGDRAAPSPDWKPGR